MANNNVTTYQRKARTRKALSAAEKKLRDDKRKATNKKAQTKFFKNNKRFILVTRKMHRFILDVVKAIRLSNNNQTSLLLQFEDQLDKWEKIVVGDNGGFTRLQSILICYTNATSVINSGRFLEKGMSPRVIPLCAFQGAKTFFEASRILSWRIEAAPAQPLIDNFCSLSTQDAVNIRPSLVLFTALLTTFCSSFPFPKKYQRDFNLEKIVFGSGCAFGDEEDLGEGVNQITFRRNHVPRNPEEDEDEELDKMEGDYGDLFGSSDELTDAGGEDDDSDSE